VPLLYTDDDNILGEERGIIEKRIQKFYLSLLMRSVRK